MIFPEKPIICVSCKKDTGYTEKGLQMRVIPPEGLQCPHCKYVIIRGKEIFLRTGSLTVKRVNYV